jgi:hypothetical protein
MTNLESYERQLQDAKEKQSAISRRRPSNQEYDASGASYWNEVISKLERLIKQEQTNG